MEGRVPGREAVTTSATKLEQTALIHGGVPTLSVLVLSSAEIQMGLQGWKRERGGWCWAQQTDMLLFCG